MLVRRRVVRADRSLSLEWLAIHSYFGVYIFRWGVYGVPRFPICLSGRHGRKLAHASFFIDMYNVKHHSRERVEVRLPAML